MTSSCAGAWSVSSHVGCMGPPLRALTSRVEGRGSAPFRRVRAIALTRAQSPAYGS